jgi:hypothetical protein
MRYYDRNLKIFEMFKKGVRQKILSMEFYLCERHIKRIIAQMRGKK